MPIRETFDIDIKATDHSAAGINSAKRNVAGLLSAEKGGGLDNLARSVGSIEKLGKAMIVAEGAAAGAKATFEIFGAIFNSASDSAEKFNTRLDGISQALQRIPVAGQAFDFGRFLGGGIFGDGSEEDKIARINLEGRAKAQAIEEERRKAGKSSFARTLDRERGLEGAGLEGFAKERFGLETAALKESAKVEADIRKLIAADRKAINSDAVRSLKNELTLIEKTFRAELGQLAGKEREAMLEQLNKADINDFIVTDDDRRNANDLANEAADIRRAAAEGISDAMRGEAIDLGGGPARRFSGGQDRFGTGLVERFEQDRPLEELKKIVKAAEETNEAIQIVADKLANSLPVLVGLGLN